jgi:hypothetical protein
MYVVHKWDFTEIPMGSELAFVNLCKVGDGPLGKLIASYTKKKVAGEKPPFALYSFNTDRHNEVTDIVKKADKELYKEIIEGIVSSDKWGDWLGVIPIDEFIAALDEELKVEEPYRRFVWASVLLKSICDSWDRESLFVITYGY